MVGDEAIPLWRKIVAGDSRRRTRLHDETGNRVALGRVLRNAPAAALSLARHRLLGQRPERPWISYDAQALLARWLTPTSRILEFGSGLSTIWYGRHAGAVLSIEHDPEWFEMIGARLRAMPQVDHRLVTRREDYSRIADADAFDLIMVDGRWRDDCVDCALERLRPGGIIYLDNADKADNPFNGDVPRAHRTLLAFAAERGLPVRRYVDFIPCLGTATLGLMVGGPALS
jgi:predicted O-methyltransferase YrrM